MAEQRVMHKYFIQKIVDKLPTCEDINTIILSYVCEPKHGVCKLLSYKLIYLGNVNSERSLVKKAIRMDQCRALLKSFDSIWDLFSTFLIKDEDKEIIEYWYNMISTGKI
jgi:hypothetical protein